MSYKLKFNYRDWIMNYELCMTSLVVQFTVGCVNLGSNWSSTSRIEPRPFWLLLWEIRFHKVPEGKCSEFFYLILLLLYKFDLCLVCSGDSFQDTHFDEGQKFAKNSTNFFKSWNSSFVVFCGLRRSGTLIYLTLNHCKTKIVFSGVR
jgi:hypothetical protein